jgi:hypothetical protein
MIPDEGKVLWQVNNNTLTHDEKTARKGQHSSWLQKIIQQCACESGRFSSAAFEPQTLLPYASRLT